MSADQLLLAAATAGLLASPHCLAMCGPLTAAGCSRAGGIERSDTIGYFGGRALSYATVGALMGYAGGSLLAGLNLLDIQNYVVAVVVAFCVVRGIAALRGRALISLKPLSSKTQGRGGFASSLLTLVASLLPRRGLGLGLATGLLPCGALAAGWALAAAAATPVDGALTMLVFSIASVPGLALALVGRKLAARIAQRLPSWAVACAWFSVALLLLGRAWMAVEQGAACHG
jgi:sulfite exporter TauE/SafE